MLKVTKKRKKKHNKIIALAKSKLNTIDTLLSCAINDSKISHEDFTNIITEKNIYENIKENIENTIVPTELPSIAELMAERSALARTREKSTTLQKSFKIITCTYKIFLMFKIITCTCKILLMFKIITCTFKR